VGSIAKVKNWVKKILTANPGGGANIQADHMSDVGDDSVPLTTDYAALIIVPGTGRAASIGYSDPKNESKSNAGDKRIYSRDKNTGGQVAEIWLKNDGTIEITGDGNITVNGVTIDPNGNITTPGSLNAQGVTDTTNNVTLSTHIHPTPSGPSSAPTPGT
jgi:hypothetical protein